MKIKTATGFDILYPATHMDQVEGLAGELLSVYAAIDLKLNKNNPTITGKLTTPNGAMGIRLGDDSEIGDINVANTQGLKGVQDPTKGYIRFGNSTLGLGWDGAKHVIGSDTIATQEWVAAQDFAAGDYLPIGGGEITGGLTISGSIASGASDMGYYQGAGTNLILKGDASGRSGIFFQSEKNGTNINHPSDYGFIQFHSYGYGGSTGESNVLVLGVANDSTDILVLQTPYNGGAKIGYKDTTNGTGLTLETIASREWMSSTGSAAKLTSARTINIGTGVSATATSFDGTSNITIPINSISEAYLSWGGKNLASSYGPIDAAMVGELGANRFAFIPAAAVVIEYSQNGGVDWVDYAATDTQKINLMNGLGNGLAIGKNFTAGVNYTNYQLRVTIRTAGGVGNLYTVLNKFVILVSTNGSSGSWCTIDARTQQNFLNSIDTWVTFANQVSIGGWSGYNVINTNGITTYGNTPDSQYGQLRFTFGCTGYNPTYTGLQVIKLLGFGGVGWTTPSNLAKYGDMYTYDSSQNTLFPAAVQGTRLISTIATGTSPLSVASTTVVANLNTDMLDGLHASSFMRGDTNATASGNHEFYATNTSGSYDTAALEIREVNLVQAAQSADAYAPALTFHWGGRVQNKIFLAADGQLYIDGNVGTKKVLYHAGNLTKATIGLTNVEDVAVSTWAGSINLNTVAPILNLGNGTQQWIIRNTSTEFFINSSTGDGTQRFKVDTSGNGYIGTNLIYHAGNKPNNTDVGLSNVTNNKQVVATAGRTVGWIPYWDNTDGASLHNGYSITTNLSISATSGQLARADAIKSYVDGILAANDAMVYKGTLGTGGTITALPTTHSAGWTYRVITAGTYAGVVCEVGDMITAVVNRSGSGNLNSDWTVFQTNLDGAVIGPASATSGYVPIYNGTSGKLLGTGYLVQTTLSSSTSALVRADAIVTALSAKENTIAAGTATQYWRGDKTWQTLNATAVGLGNVENVAVSTWAGSTNLVNLGAQINVGGGTQTWVLRNTSTEFIIASGTGDGTTRFRVDISGNGYIGTNLIYHAGNNNIGTGATNFAAGNHTHSIYLPLAGGTITGQVQYTTTTLATTGTVNIDFSGANLRTMAALTGNITFTGSNYAVGRSVTIRIIGGTSNRTLTFPSGWVFVGTKPTTLLANKRAILTLTSFTTVESEVIAAWAVQS